MDRAKNLSISTYILIGVITIEAIFAISLVISFLFYGAGSKVPVSYLETDSQGVIFTQFTDINGNLTGALEETVYTDSSQTATALVRLAFTGTEKDNQITLNLGQNSNALGLNGIVFGSLKNQKLSLNLPSSEGTLVATQFQVSNLTAYNLAVKRLLTIACDNNATANGVVASC